MASDGKNQHRELKGEEQRRHTRKLWKPRCSKKQRQRRRTKRGCAIASQQRKTASGRKLQTKERELTGSKEWGLNPTMVRGEAGPLNPLSILKKKGSKTPMPAAGAPKGGEH